MTRLVYMATPIDFSSVAAKRLEQIKASVLGAGHGVFCPAQAWTVPYKSTPNTRLQQANIDVLSSCNGLLAVLETKSLTIGVIVEMMYAKDMGMPVVVVGELCYSWALPYLGIVSFEELEPALSYLSDEMNRNTKELILDDD